MTRAGESSMERPGDDSGTSASLMAELRGGGAVAEGAPDDGAATKTKVSRATLTVGGVVLISGGLLLTMRQLGLGPALSLGETTIEYSPSAHADTIREDHRRLMTALERADTGAQIPADSLPKNPFKLGAQPMAVSDEVVDPNADAKRQAALQQQQLAERQKRIEMALAGLELQSVLAGRVPVARINNATVRIGDVLDELFTVTAISGSGVALTVDGQTFNLTMEAGDAPDHGAPKARPKKK